MLIVIKTQFFHIILNPFFSPLEINFSLSLLVNQVNLFFIILRSFQKTLSANEKESAHKLFFLNISAYSSTQTRENSLEATV